MCQPEPWTWYFAKRGNHLSSFEPRKPFMVLFVYIELESAENLPNDLVEEKHHEHLGAKLLPDNFFYHDHRLHV